MGRVVETSDLTEVRGRMSRSRVDLLMDDKWHTHKPSLQEQT